MGGAPLYESLAQDKAVGDFACLRLGSMMGPTIVFTICCLVLSKNQIVLFLARGILYGFGNYYQMFSWWIACSRSIVVLC